MAAALLVAGLLVIALPAAARPLGRRVGAAEWTQLCLVALLGGAALVEAGALLLAAPTVLRAAGIPALASACDALVGPLLPLGAAGGWSAFVVAVGLPILAVRGWDRARAQVDGLVIEPWLGRHQPRDGYELVVLPTPEPLAYSVADPPQVVISEGLAAALTGEQLTVVIGHEVAHLRGRHPRLLVAAAAARHALVWWPPATRTHAAFRSALERWADDHAAGDDPQRRRALREALVTVAISAADGPVAAFSLADALAERVEAMDRPPRLPLPLHTLLYVPGAAASIVAVLAIGAWADQARLVVAMAGRCTI